MKLLKTQPTAVRPEHSFITFTLFALTGFAVLMALGMWQIERKAWKEALLATIAQRARAAPVTLPEAEKAWQRGEAGFLHVSVYGRFDHARELYLWAADADLGPGYHVYTPLFLEDGRGILVNRGFIPAALKDRGARKEGEIPGTVRVTGLVRLPETRPGLFTPANDPEKNLWFWRDLPSMAQTAFGPHRPSVLPFFLESDALPAPPGGWPKGGATPPSLPNRHLEYALTWFTLAAAVAVLYILWWRSSRRTEPVRQKQNC